MSLLKQDTIRKRQVDKALPESETELKFESGGNKKYKVKAIFDSAVYSQQANNSN